VPDASTVVVVRHDSHGHRVLERNERLAGTATGTEWGRTSPYPVEHTYANEFQDLLRRDQLENKSVGGLQPDQRRRVDERADRTLAS